MLLKLHHTPVYSRKAKFQALKVGGSCPACCSLDWSPLPTMWGLVPSFAFNWISSAHVQFGFYF